MNSWLRIIDALNRLFDPLAPTPPSTVDDMVPNHGPLTDGHTSASPTTR